MGVGNKQALQYVRSYHAIICGMASYMEHTIYRFIMLLFGALTERKKETALAAFKAVAQGMLMYHPPGLNTSLMKSDKHVVGCHGSFKSSVMEDVTPCVLCIRVHNTRPLEAH